MNLLLRRFLRLPRLRLLAHLAERGGGANVFYRFLCDTKRIDIHLEMWMCVGDASEPVNETTHHCHCLFVSSRSKMHKVHWSTLLCAHCTSPMSSTSQLHTLAHTRACARLENRLSRLALIQSFLTRPSCSGSRKKRSRESINVFIFIGLTFISAICFNYIMQIYLLDLLEAFFSISPSVVVFNLIDI